MVVIILTLTNTNIWNCLNNWDVCICHWERKRVQIGGGGGDREREADITSMFISLLHQRHNYIHIHMYTEPLSLPIYRVVDKPCLHYSHTRSLVGGLVLFPNNTALKWRWDQWNISMCVCTYVVYTNIMPTRIDKLCFVCEIIVDILTRVSEENTT